MGRNIYQIGYTKSSIEYTLVDHTNMIYLNTLLNHTNIFYQNTRDHIQTQVPRQVEQIQQKQDKEN